MNKTDLKSLSDDELLVCLSSVSKDSKRIGSELVAPIGEVDARKLYARKASPSMHKYCTDVLRLSDAEAYFRIAAARASRRYPVLLTMLEDGRLHLSAIEVLAPHLDKLNELQRDELLARATHKTKREVKELVAELAPKPDVPPRIRKIPERGKEKAEQPPKEEPKSAWSEDPTLNDESAPSGRSTSEPSNKPAAKTRDERQTLPRAAPPGVSPR